MKFVHALGKEEKWNKYKKYGKAVQGYIQLNGPTFAYYENNRNIKTKMNPKPGRVRYIQLRRKKKWVRS